MSSRFRTLASRLAGQMPTLLVLAGLAALFVWGAVADWKLSAMFPSLARAQDKGPDKRPEPDNPALEPGLIALDSPAAAADAGVATGDARRQEVARHVEAPAVLAFDQTRYAHLAPRAAGAAWRVLRYPGVQPDRMDAVLAGEVLALIASAELGKAKADFLSSYVQYEVKSRLLARAEAASSSLPEQKLREAQLALREARVALLNAQQTLGSFGLPVRLESLQGLSDDQVASRLNTLGLPLGLVRTPDLPANLLPLTAPFAGQIIRCDLVEGEMAAPTQPAFVIADVDWLWLLIDVRQEDVDRLAVGQPVTFRAAAANQEAEGTLTWVSPEVDVKTRTVKARARLANTSRRLRPATFGTARIQTDSAAAVTVPADAVQYDGQSRRVFVRKDEKTFEPRLVLPGVSAAGRTELRDPRVLLAASIAARQPALVTLTSLASADAFLAPVRPGEVVATTGSQVLKAEMLKGRIGGED